MSYLLLLFSNLSLRNLPNDTIYDSANQSALVKSLMVSCVIMVDLKKIKW